MSKWKLGSCPRCHGDLYTEKDLDGWHEQCLQCGYLHYLPGTAKLRLRREQPAETDYSSSAVKAATKSAAQYASVARN